jgi:hypothetical protein
LIQIQIQTQEQVSVPSSPWTCSGAPAQPAGRVLQVDSWASTLLSKSFPSLRDCDTPPHFGCHFKLYSSVNDVAVENQAFLIDFRSSPLRILINFALSRASDHVTSAQRW